MFFRCSSGAWEGAVEDRCAGLTGGRVESPVGLLVAPQTQELGQIVGRVT